MYKDNHELTYRNPKDCKIPHLTEGADEPVNECVLESDGVSRSWLLMFMDAGGDAGVGGCL